MKKVMFGIVKFVATMGIIMTVVYFALVTGLVEAAVEVVADHVSVEEHFEGIEISTQGITPKYTKSISIR